LGEGKVDTCCGFVRAQASAEADYGYLRADSNATASGVDYTQPIPEPATSGGIAALVTLACLRRRRV
jgi:hypothetical protein